jgi:hypothetical protein
VHAADYVSTLRRWRVAETDVAKVNWERHFFSLISGCRYRVFDACEVCMITIVCLGALHSSRELLAGQRECACRDGRAGSLPHAATSARRRHRRNRRRPLTRVGITHASPSATRTHTLKHAAAGGQREGILAAVSIPDRLYQ